MKAKDLMSRDVVALSPLTEIKEAARFLTERRITGAPVVDKKGRLMGVVSQTDLTRFQARQAGVLDQEEDLEKTPVVAVMTHDAITCDKETPIEDVSRLMLERRIHRVLVTKNGKLCGILTSMDLLRALPGAGATKRPGGWRMASMLRR